MKASNTFSDLAEPVADFLFGLGADPNLGSCIVELSGSGLDQQIVVAVDVGGIAELAHQHHAALRQIVGQ